MSVLHLARHGQASFFSDNYDRLSPLGELQARRLGEYFARLGTQFDAVHSGPAERQRRTAEIAVQALRQAGCPCPDPTVIEGLNEHSGDLLLSRPSARAFLEQHPELAPLESAFRQAREPDAVQASFQRLFEAVVLRWSDGKLSVPGIEQWSDFQSRAKRALDSIVSHPDRGRTVLAVSSVGPISVAVQLALHTSLPVSLHLGWRLRNASVTTFLYTSGRITLDSFNSLAHLANPEEITYR